MTPILDSWSAAIAGLLSGLLPALAVAAAAWVLLKFSPGMNAASRHAVWWLVLVLAVLLPVGFALRDASHVPVRPWLPRAALSLGTGGPIPFSPGPFVAVVRGPSAAPVRRIVSGIPVPSPWRPAAISIPPAAPFQLRPGPWSGWLLVLWTLPFAAQLVLLVWSYRRLRGIKLRSSVAPPELCDSFRKWATENGPARGPFSKTVAQFGRRYARPELDAAQPPVAPDQQYELRGERQRPKNQEPARPRAGAKLEWGGWGNRNGSGAPRGWNWNAGSCGPARPKAREPRPRKNRPGRERDGTTGPRDFSGNQGRTGIKARFAQREGDRQQHGQHQYQPPDTSRLAASLPGENFSRTQATARVQRWQQAAEQAHNRLRSKFFSVIALPRNDFGEWPAALRLRFCIV